MFFEVGNHALIDVYGVVCTRVDSCVCSVFCNRWHCCCARFGYASDALPACLFTFVRCSRVLRVRAFPLFSMQPCISFLVA